MEIREKELLKKYQKVVSIDSDNNITLEMPSCGACRTCEMACGYHHAGEFNPDAGSFQIIEREDKPGYCIRIAAENKGKREGCDLCKDLEVPLCVEHCREYDDLYNLLVEFEKIQSELKTRKEGKNEK